MARAKSWGWLEACRRLSELHSEWGIRGERPEHDKIRAEILRDLRYRRDKPEFAGVCRNLRAQLMELGEIRRVYKAQGLKL